MAKVDTAGWKQFRLGDLFPLVNSKPYHAQFLEEDESGVRYVTRTMFDNGVKCYVQKEERFQVNPAGTISFGAENADFFYQNEPYITGNKMYYLDTQGLTENACLFLKSILQVTFTYQFSFSEGMIPARIKDEMISLPVTPDGQPDWAYMDAYMSEVLKKEEVFAEHLASLTAEAVVDGHLLDTSAWKAFHLYDIFDIDMGNKFDRGKMPAGDAVNFVGRTGSNNGINAVCDFVDGVPPYEAGALTLALGGTIGACFVQMDPFYTSQNVIVLFPKRPVSLAVKLFMAKIIWHVSDMYYDAFSNELNRHIKTDFVFYLPVTADGTPDWAWMEQYMQRQMDKAAALVEHLDAVWN